MKKAVKAAVAVIFFLNIAVTSYLIYAVVRGSAVQSWEIGKHIQFKLNLDVAYIQYSKSESKSTLLTGDNDDDNKPSLAFLSLLKPVAHFSGLDFVKELKDELNGTVAVRNWANSEGSERTLLYNDMTYQNGSLTVPAAGVYHITSHVKFYVEDNKKDDNSSQTFHHQIVRYSASSWKQVVLFENVVTECREGINDGAHLEYPSLTGGLAQLDAGDQVIVKVSHFDLLKHDKDWHYFDIHLV